MKRFVLVLVLGGMLSAVSRADTLDFGSPSIQPAGASLSYTGGAADLIASGIVVASINDLTNATASSCTGCVLSFTSGASTGTWTWGAGAATSLTVTGTDGAVSGTLLSGMILNAAVGSCGGVTCVEVNTFINTVNPALAAVLGYTAPSPNSWTGSSSLEIVLSASPGSSFSLTNTNIGSGDLGTTPVVPEPSSLLLLGSGLLGFASLARKKLFTL
jgi:hypothetical protein